ncbi:MAG: hypothetical protein HOI47_09245 [Candidatus Scalindua sp.]|jgi:hypothetical protein|nr:hypothetical protein [Candidatus Scalindua sp.]MBT6226828.1 hypothetical protein [Candidatus Scalindua sp.]
MARPLEMLIIDDDKEFVESLYADAQRSQILLTHKSNLEDGQLFLKSSKARKLSGVILDVVCMTSKDDEVAKSSFITEALDFFAREASHLPVVILTGEPDQYKNLSELFKRKKVYSKGRDEEEMLLFLKEEALKLDRVKTINKYKDIFEIIEEFFDADTEDALINCLRSLNTSDKTQINNNLACIRRLQEKIYTELNKSKPDWVPIECIEGDVKVKAILRHLREGNRVDKKTDNFAKSIYETASDYGAHQNRSQASPVSKYTVHSAAYALLDLFLWFKEVVSEEG